MITRYHTGHLSATTKNEECPEELLLPKSKPAPLLITGMQRRMRAKQKDDDNDKSVSKIS